MIAALVLAAPCALALPVQDEDPQTRLLREQGVTPHVLVVADASRIPSGAEPDEALRGLVDVGWAFDLATLAGLPGHVHLGFQAIRGDDGGARAGNLQGVSSVDAPDRTQVARAFWELEFEGRAVTHLRLGKLDANAVFDVAQAGAYFQSPSAGYSPTILGMPTYPDPSFGATIGRLDDQGTGARLGVFDGSVALGTRTGSLGPAALVGAPSALFWIAEGAWCPGAARLLLGGWWIDAELPRLDGGTRAGAGGLYAVAEQRVAGARAATTGTVDVFAQAGNAPAAVSPFRTHLAAGVLLTGPNAARPDDRFGLYATHVRAGDDPARDRDAELAVELLSSFALADGLRLEPDVQYVRARGGDAQANAWVATLRLVLSW